jgi:hypothetical protein
VQVDEQVGEGFDVDVVAIGLAAHDLGAEAQAGQASAQHLVVSDTGDRDVGSSPRRDLEDPAELGLYRFLVPLGVERASHADGSRGRAFRGEAERHRKRPRVRPHAARPPEGPDLQIAAGGACTAGPRRPEQLVEEVRDGVGGERAREQLQDPALLARLAVASVLVFRDVGRAEAQT